LPLANGASYQRTTLQRSEGEVLIGAGGMTEVERMRDFDPRLGMQVIGDEIIITLGGTSYSVTYFKQKAPLGCSQKTL
jgi:hypothetical protein